VEEGLQERCFGLREKGEDAQAEESSGAADAARLEEECVFGDVGCVVGSRGVCGKEDGEEKTLVGGRLADLVCELQVRFSVQLLVHGPTLSVSFCFLVAVFGVDVC